MPLKCLAAWKRSPGFTLPELIVIITLVAVIAAVAVTVFISLIRLFVLIPKETRVRLIASQIQDIMLEGDGEARGLRFASSLSTVDGNEVAFGYETEGGEAVSVAFRWDSDAEKIYRQVDEGGEVAIPYDFGSEVGVKTKDAAPAVFTYFDENGQSTTIPASVERIEVNFSVETGSGDFSAWDAAFDLSSGVDVKQFCL